MRSVPKRVFAFRYIESLGQKNQFSGGQNFRDLLYKHIIQVENENLRGGAGGGGAQSYHCPPIQKVPPSPLPTPVIYIWRIYVAYLFLRYIM